jgi:hypothetical protein
MHARNGHIILFCYICYLIISAADENIFVAATSWDKILPTHVAGPGISKDAGYMHFQQCSVQYHPNITSTISTNEFLLVVCVADNKLILNSAS